MWAGTQGMRADKLERPANKCRWTFESSSESPPAASSSSASAYTIHKEQVRTDVCRLASEPRRPVLVASSLAPRVWLDSLLITLVDGLFLIDSIEPLVGLLANLPQDSVDSFDSRSMLLGTVSVGSVDRL